MEYDSRYRYGLSLAWATVGVVSGGCAIGGGRGAAGTLALMLATVFALRRRRARR